MAKYTIELGSMVSAHAHLMSTQGDDRILNISDGSGYEKTFNMPEFVWLSPNEVIEKYAKSFIDRHVGTGLQESITDNEDMNAAIYDRFCQTLIRHFWGYEIGQENPLYFLTLLRSCLDMYLPIWYQGYQKLFIDKAQWITNVNDGTSLTVSKSDAAGNSKQASIAGNADTPQNELDFKMNTGDPTDDYNFHYASDVNGAKSTGSTTNSANGTSNTTTHSEGRNAVITDLLNKMLTYTNGIYFDLFDKLKAEGLFMFVN
jgi:hypothetical protein